MTLSLFLFFLLCATSSSALCLKTTKPGDCGKCIVGVGCWKHRHESKTVPPNCIPSWKQAQRLCTVEYHNAVMKAQPQYIKDPQMLIEALRIECNRNSSLVVGTRALYTLYVQSGRLKQLVADFDASTHTFKSAVAEQQIALARNSLAYNILFVLVACMVYLLVAALITAAKFPGFVGHAERE